MDPRNVITSIGSGVTTFIIVTVVVIELLEFEFSAIIGLPIGIFAGIAVLYILLLTISDVPESAYLLLTGYATFGLLLLLLLALQYVNIGRSVLTTPRVLGISLIGALLAIFGTWYTN